MSDELEVQRRAFEAQFGSLESMGFEDKTKRAEESETSDESSNDDGREESDEREDNSEDESQDEEEKEEDDEDEVSEEESQPRVIKFQGPSDDYTPISKKEQRLLRSGKPLRQEKSSEPVEESSEEDENLKNDIELQRFLKESHLLSALGNGTANVNDDSVIGKARARTLEMRLRGLSETNGRSTTLEKMPVNVRKGMIKKHRKRIEKHETEAKEGGIVLHNVKKGQFRQIDHTHRNDIERRIGSSIKKQQEQRNKRRQRGLRIQSVGKSTRNGLRISQQDIDRINNRK